MNAAGNHPWQLRRSRLKELAGRLHARAIPTGKSGLHHPGFEFRVRSDAADLLSSAAGVGGHCPVSQDPAVAGFWPLIGPKTTRA
jgi:hypothetical protein